MNFRECLRRFRIKKHISPCLLLQLKYTEGGKQKISTSLYSLLPETTETQLAKQMSEMQSEVNIHSKQNLTFIKVHFTRVCTRALQCELIFFLWCCRPSTRKWARGRWSLLCTLYSLRPRTSSTPKKRPC